MAGERWTRGEEKYLTVYHKRRSAQQMADVIGRTVHSVRKRMRRLGLTGSDESQAKKRAWAYGRWRG